MTSKQSSGPPLGDQPLMDVAESVGQMYGMTGSEVMQHIAMGDVPHHLAPESECGATDPRDGSKWCRKVSGHSGNHNWYVGSNQEGSDA
jgi:hypothetical protein